MKRFLEMRGADCGPAPHITALSAFWVGLLYDQTALDAAWDLVKGWTAEQRDQLRSDVPKQAFGAKVNGRSVHDITREALAIARGGLKRRARIDVNGHDETTYLDPLDMLVARGETVADQMLARFHASWAGRIDPVFTDYAY